jgi:hypothetical protein
MARAEAGRINGVHAPEGSIMGPMWTNELVAVIENDERGVVLGYATKEELDAPTDDPRTWAEFQKNRRAQLMTRARLAALFGGDPT